MNEIIKNEIKSINSKDLDLLKSKLLRDNKVLVVELAGDKIQSWVDYVSEVQSKFSFPTPCTDSVDRYLEWIRDLEWLEQEKVVMIINHFSDFCKENPSMKILCLAHLWRIRNYIHISFLNQKPLTKLQSQIR